MNRTTERTMQTFHYEPSISEKKQNGKKRVAAYCRVSTLEEEQAESFQVQCSYYKNFLGTRPDMELVGIYGDQGKSGLHAEKRTEFQRMIKACREGKIDEIWVKSISRFARNALDCKTYLEELTVLGIRVYFEKEDVYSDDPQCSLVLSLMASIAQQESNSLSTSIKWSNYHNNELGNPTRVCAYGYKKAPRQRGDAHTWIIDPEKADRVRLIFELADSGMMPTEISKHLIEYEKDKKQTRRWGYQTVKNILTNEVYKGDLLTSKTVTPDYITGKRCENNGKYAPQYYIEEHHEPIVSREVFDRVQLKIRKEKKHA